MASVIKNPSDKYYRVAQKINVNADEILVETIKRTHELIFDICNKIKINQTVYIQAIGNNINRALVAVEVIRENVADIHMYVNFKSITLQENYYPTQKGLDVLKSTKNITILEIQLIKTTDLSKINNGDIGYHVPLVPEKPQTLEELMEKNKEHKRTSNTGGYKKEYQNRERREPGRTQGNRESRGGRRGRGGRGNYNDNRDGTRNNEQGDNNIYYNNRDSRGEGRRYNNSKNNSSYDNRSQSKNDQQNKYSGTAPQNNYNNYSQDRNYQDNQRSSNQDQNSQTYQNRRGTGQIYTNAPRENAPRYRENAGRYNDENKRLNTQSQQRRGGDSDTHQTYREPNVNNDQSDYNRNSSRPTGTQRRGGQRREN